MPPLETQIETKLNQQSKVKILEIGCGSGHLLLDLLNIFENKIELHGINRRSASFIRSSKSLYKTNSHFKIMDYRKLKSLKLPVIHFIDAQDLSSFEENNFDFIISQTVMEHLLKKAYVLERSSHLLAPGGIFLHDLDHIRATGVDFIDSDLPRFVIYKDAKKISTLKYLREHNMGFKLVDTKSYQVVLAIFQKGQDNLDLNLKPDWKSSFKLNCLRVCDKTFDKKLLWGFRSVYSTKEPK